MERYTLSIPSPVLDDARTLAARRGMKLSKVLRHSILIGVNELRSLAPVEPKPKEIRR